MKETPLLAPTQDAPFLEQHWKKAGGYFTAIVYVKGVFQGQMKGPGWERLQLTSSNSVVNNTGDICSHAASGPSQPSFPCRLAKALC